MPQITLTDIAARNRKPAAGKQVVYIVKTLKGFGVRIADRGAESTSPPRPCEF